MAKAPASGRHFTKHRNCAGSGVNNDETWRNGIKSAFIMGKGSGA